MIAQVSPPAFASIGTSSSRSCYPDSVLMSPTGWKYYLVFAICGFTNALFFWAFLPETRGIPLEGSVACATLSVTLLIIF